MVNNSYLHWVASFGKVVFVSVERKESEIKLSNDFSVDPVKFKLHLFDNAMLQPVSHFTQGRMQHAFELHRHKKIIAHQLH